MATLVLSAAGAALGGAMGGSVFGVTAAVIGRAVGATLGNIIDQRLMGAGSQVVQSGRASSLRMMGGREGAPISRVYGRMRVAGQVIWSSRFKETSRVSGSGKGLAPSQPAVRSYSYSISFAVGLCEGEIMRVGRIWADGKLMKQKHLNMRVHRGSEDQLPDPLIEAVEGAGNAPACRGLAYLVFEDLPLADYGNRIPQISAEVFRRVGAAHVADLIQGVALIPGTGEYSLATEPVHYPIAKGKKRSANVNNASGRTDFVESIAQLNADLPNCASVSLVVSWFGDDLRCDRCAITPRVEQKDTEGSRAWKVSGAARADALAVSQVEGRAAFGGTPSDASVVQAIQHLHGLGKKVMFYPFVLMDIQGGNGLTDPWTGGQGQPNVPWRGRITLADAPGRAGSTDKTVAAANEVANFFGSAAPGQFSIGDAEVGYTGAAEWSYRRFILHYAHLCALAGGVDAFCLGSELRGLTQIRSASAAFPTVGQLKALAADVRAILGPGCTLTYAADWSEYFGYQPQDGSGDVLFHLDPLWSDANIDAVGIDNYMPLSDWRNSLHHADAHWGSIHNGAYLRANIEGGEGYDWYYETAAKRALQMRDPISDGAYGEPWVFRNKDLRNWWLNPHHNRIGGIRSAAPTDWVPQAKPIAFTEIGCPAVDNGTNQPNMFSDARSAESGLPWYSDGCRDDLMQASYLKAVHQYWGDPQNNPMATGYGDRMVDMSLAHVWAWDARPWPDFPSKGGLWADARNYGIGHWVNGRAGNVSLADVVADVCRACDLAEVDVSGLHGSVTGCESATVETGRQILQPLMLAFGFDGFEQNGGLWFKNRSGVVDLALASEECVVDAAEPAGLTATRAGQEESAGRLRLGYVKAAGAYHDGSVECADPMQDNAKVSATQLPLVLSDAEGQMILERWHAQAAVARETINFALPKSMLALNVGDVIGLNEPGCVGLYRIDRLEDSASRQVEAVRINPRTYVSVAMGTEEISTEDTGAQEISVLASFMDLPLSDDAGGPLVAVAADPWPGGVAIYASASDGGYQLNQMVETRSVIGETLDVIPGAEAGRWMRRSIRLLVASGMLQSRSEEEVLNGANLAAIRSSGANDWEIIQFRDAILVGQNQYVLDGILRGQAGTDFLSGSDTPVGSEFVLLDGSAARMQFASSARGLDRHYRIGPASEPYSDASYQHQIWAFRDIGLRPYAPAHLRAAPGANGDLMVSWIRRTRLDGDNWDMTEVPLGEASETYSVRIGDGLTWVRSSETSQALTSYSQVQRAADGLVAPYIIEVAQISDRFGAGPYSRIVIDA